MNFNLSVIITIVYAAFCPTISMLDMLALNVKVFTLKHSSQRAPVVTYIAVITLVVEFRLVNFLRGTQKRSQTFCSRKYNSPSYTLQKVSLSSAFNCIVMDTDCGDFRIS
jgi:hypothetical protein